jgi:hypothetical protein
VRGQTRDILPENDGRGKAFAANRPRHTPPSRRTSVKHAETPVCTARATLQIRRSVTPPTHSGGIRQRHLRHDCRRSCLHPSSKARRALRCSLPSAERLRASGSGCSTSGAPVPPGVIRMRSRCTICRSPTDRHSRFPTCVRRALANAQERPKTLHSRELGPWSARVPSAMTSACGRGTAADCLPPTEIEAVSAAKNETAP